MVKEKSVPGGCVFCEIITGQRESQMVFEDDDSVAFLDQRPVFKGHCLLVPRKHFETMADLPQALIAPLFSAAQILSRAVEIGMRAEGTFVAVNNRVSQSVPHLHIHVVPRRKGDGLRGFFWPRTRYANEAEGEGVKSAIREAVELLQSGNK